MHSSQDLLDPEDRLIDESDPLATKHKMLDKTIADTFQRVIRRRRCPIRMRIRLRPKLCLIDPVADLSRAP
jgi:hypothetical protein